MTEQSEGNFALPQSDRVVMLREQELEQSEPVKGTAAMITFNRRELNEILRIYGFKVAAGEWLDYAIDHLKDRAVFSVFRKSSEIAMFKIEKIPKMAAKQGAYSVTSVAGQVLKRGSDLKLVLSVFEKRPKLEVL